MRKNDLIKMLNEIEGNPEVVLWNGSVGDWMHINKPELFPFNRMKKSFVIQTKNLERKFRYDLPEMTGEEIKKQKPEEWQIGNGNRFGVLKEENFEHKNRIVIQPKPRGIKSFDRAGTFEY